MNSYQLEIHLRALLDATRPESQLPKVLFVLSKGRDKLCGHLLDLLHSPSRSFFAQGQQDAREQLQQLRQQLDAFPLGQVFHDAIGLQATLQRLDQDVLGGGVYFQELETLTAAFYDALEGYMQGRTDSTFTLMLSEAGQAFPALICGRNLAGTILQALAPQRSGGGARLTLQLAGTADVGFCSEKLLALGQAYDALHDLVEAEAPLDLQKVEASPLLMTIAGADLVVELLQRVVVRWWGFVRSRAHRGHSSLDNRIAATQMLVTLSDEFLGKDLVHLAEDERRLQPAALGLSEVMERLLEDVSHLTVNGARLGHDGLPEAQGEGCLEPLLMSA